MNYPGPRLGYDTPPPIVNGGADEEEVRRLPWGCLPAEQYLIVSRGAMDSMCF
jgi:hypothetical protein